MKVWCNGIVFYRVWYVHAKLRLDPFSTAFDRPERAQAPQSADLHSIQYTNTPIPVQALAVLHYCALLQQLSYQPGSFNSLLKCDTESLSYHASY